MKSHVQVALRWLIQQGNIIRSARNLEQARENAGMRGFGLSPDKVDLIARALKV